MKKWLFGCLLGSFLGIGTAFGADNTASNVTNYPASVNMDLMIIPLFQGGTSTAELNTSSILSSFVVPSKYKLRSAKARAEYFDNGTATNRFYIDIKNALTGTTTAASLLSSVMAIGTSSSSVTGAISNSTIADESLVNIMGYGSSTRYLTIQLYMERTN